MISDPISDFIIRIKNAGMVGKSSVVVPYSKLKHAIAETLSKEGYIGIVQKKGKKVRKALEIELLYQDGKHGVQGIQRVSKPSRRVYMKASTIPSVKHGKGDLILSTPKGIMTDKVARKEKLGGEALIKIW